MPSNGFRVRIPLVILLGSLTAFSAQAQNAEATRLTREFNRAYTAKAWPEAIEICHKLDKLAPGNPTNTYNLACVYALAGDRENAAHWATKCAESGFADRYLFRNDADLALIRDTADYAAALEKVEQNAEKALEEFKKVADRSEPLIVVPGPVDDAKPMPLILVLHPYGGTAEGIVEVWRKPARRIGALLVAPRAVSRVEGAGFQWGTVDEVDYLLTRALEKACKDFKIDEQRIILTGFSQGGFMTFNLGMLHADRFAGLIPVSGAYMPAYAPVPKQESSRPRVYIMIGAEDAAAAANREAEAALKEANIPVRLVLYPNLGHSFPPDPTTELGKALEFVLE